MRKHRNHFLEKTPGNEPPSTRNLSLLFTSAKIMSFTTLLILFVDDYRLTPLEVSERLNKHLSNIGLDDDVSMLEYSVTSIISTLFQSCDILHSLNNKQYRVTNKDVISYTDATKRCTQVIMVSH